MTDETRIPIERIEANGCITKGTARMRGVTIDDFRSATGVPLNLPPGAQFAISIEILEGEDA